MTSKSFTATKSRSNRPGWSVTFRHPLRTDSRGDRGLKVRKGLSTSDENEADSLVAQLNEFLQDEYWWNGDRRVEAEKKFAAVVVAAFFDGIEVATSDHEATRTRIIPLPSRDDGYSTIQFLGTTGAGKTTLLRHVIGSDAKEDRFPSISPNKTTTADYEIICDRGNFQAAVTFMPEHEVRAHIDECIEEACLEVVQNKADEKIAGALLEHREQRFRLSYVLGAWSTTEVSEDDDFSFENDMATKEEILPDEEVTVKEREKNSAKLKSYIIQIKELANEVANKLSQDLGTLASQITSDDRATWLELLGFEVFNHSLFSEINIGIMDDISDRFSRIDVGDLEKSRSGWPILWHYSSENRKEFLSAVRWFSSNHHLQFGRLLTPLVDGIRVKGPLFSETNMDDEEPKLVLLDGQGLGHTASSASSISTRVTKKFSAVDMVLLVDNAQQPMQAAPLALLRSVGSSGFADKLAIAFTHFDQVKGPNLKDFEQKRGHVLSSVGNAVSSLRNAVGPGVAGVIERQVDKHTVFLGGLDRKTVELPKGIKRELSHLISMMQHSIDEQTSSDCEPIYEFKGIEIAMHDAILAFREPWNARLGLSYRDGIPKEHWTRVKALSRRLANHWDDEYDTLTPVADFLARLQEEASKWLDHPAGWSKKPENEEEREASIDRIRQSVFSELFELTKSRLTNEKVANWRQAYDYRGRGSTEDRARMIASIFIYAAPSINAAMSNDARSFLNQLHDILKDAIIKAGGKIQ